MNESSVDLINLYTGEDYVKPLINFLKKEVVKDEKHMHLNIIVN